MSDWWDDHEPDCASLLPMYAIESACDCGALADKKRRRSGDHVEQFLAEVERMLRGQDYSFHRRMLKDVANVLREAQKDETAAVQSNTRRVMAWYERWRAQHNEQ